MRWPRCRCQLHRSRRRCQIQPGQIPRRLPLRMRLQDTIELEHCTKDCSQRAVSWPFHESLPFTPARAGVLLQVTCSGQVQGSHNTPQLTKVCKNTQRGGHQDAGAAPAGPVTEATAASFFTVKPRGWPLPKRYSTAYTPGARLAALRSTSAPAQQTGAFSHTVHHARAWRTRHLLQDLAIHWQVSQPGGRFKGISC